MASALGTAFSSPSLFSIPKKAPPLGLLSKSRTLSLPVDHSSPHPSLLPFTHPRYPSLLLSRKWKLSAAPEEASDPVEETQMAGSAADESAAPEEPLELEEVPMPEPVEAQIASSTAGAATKGEEVFAVVMIGSRQYIVFPGRFIYTQRLKGANVSDKIILNKVLLVGSRTKAYVGQPVVTNAAVHAVVEEQGLDRKVIIFKFKKKKNYRRTIGHRQPNTRIRITGITGYEDFPAETMPEMAPA